MVLFIKRVLGILLILISFAFYAKNYTYSQWLYGVGHQAQLYDIGIINDLAYKNNSLYMLKSYIDENDVIKYVYRISIVKFFKIPIWPFSKDINSNKLISDLYDQNTYMQEENFNRIPNISSFDKATLFAKKDTYFFEYITLLFSSFGVTMGCLLILHDMQSIYIYQIAKTMVLRFFIIGSICLIIGYSLIMLYSPTHTKKVNILIDLIFSFGWMMAAIPFMIALLLQCFMILSRVKINACRNY